jgi:shikimate dehydrogenase
MIASKQGSYVLGVTGYPLGHSLSPRLHEAALLASGLTGEYRLYPVPPLPAGQESLEALIDSIRDGRLDGLNVTIPHKQAVIPYLDELTPLALQIGAVNTVYRRGSCLIGDNTDAPGFLADLQKQSSRVCTPQAALVLGAGGSARAVVHALLTAGWQVTIAARRLEMAQKIKDSLSFINQPCELIELERLPGYILSLDHTQYGLQVKCTSSRHGDHRTLSLVVNTTPVGMYPDSAHSPWPKDLPLPDDAFVYDLVYNPVDTALVRAARSAGLTAVSGLGMLVEQAALAFERWTGVRPPIHAMRQAVITYQEIQ